MSSSRKSGSVCPKSLRHSGLAREIALRRRPGLPHTQKPQPIKTQLGKAVQLGIRNIVQGRALTKLSRKLGQPDAGIDLVKRRIG